MIPESLKDPKLIVSVFAIINTLVLALVFNWWRNRKKLTYTIHADESLLSVKSEVKDRVKITFDGRYVANVRLVKISIQNVGNVHIDQKDFLKPITISIGDGDILSFELMNAIPDDLPVETELADNKSLIIKPLVLNKAESFTIKLLACIITDNKVSVSSRFAGFALTKEVEVNRTYNRLVTVQLLSAGIGFIIMFIGFFGLINSTLAFWGMMTFMVMSTVAFIGWLIKEFKHLNQKKEV